MSTNKHFNKIELRGKDNEIVLTKVISKKEEFSLAFRNLVDKAVSKNYKLILEYYNGLRGNIDNLKALQSVKSFEIKNFTKLNPKSIPILIEHTKLEKNEFSQRIRESITRRRIVGLDVGNPQIADIAQDLGLKQRIQNSLYDANNIKAKERIVQLKKTGESFNSIAKILNEEGYKTRRGKKFYQKSAQRLFDRYKLLSKDFERKADKLIENLYFKDKDVSILKGFEKNCNFEKEIILNITIMPVKVILYNNNGKQVFSSVRNSKEKFQLQIEGTLELFPGLHYFQIWTPEEEGAKVLYTSSFTIKYSLVADIEKSL